MMPHGTNGLERVKMQEDTPGTSMAGFSFLNSMSQCGIFSLCLTALKNQLAVQFIMVQLTMFYVQ
jgi:hypothetical protein